MKLSGRLKIVERRARGLKPVRIKATVRAEVPPSPERLGEIAEQLLQILAEERAKKRLREAPTAHERRLDDLEGK